MKAKKEWWIKEQKREVEERKREQQNFYSSSRWRRLREYVLQLDGYRCQNLECKNLLTDSSRLELHHRINVNEPTGKGWQLRFSLYDNNGKRNLITFCDQCHAQVTRQEQQTGDNIDHEKLFEDRTKEFEI